MRGQIVAQLLLCWAAFTVPAQGGPDQYKSQDFLTNRASVSLVPRAVYLSDRTNCGLNDTAPPNRQNTTQRVADLIMEMNKYSYAAYIIPSGDEHQSEYPAAADLRRQYISGFSGSAGTAIVLSNGTRALWTDGRYFLQADDELDCNWLMMRSGLPGVPTIVEFLRENLSNGDQVAADSSLVGYSSWIEAQEELSQDGYSISMVESAGNLVDTVWEAEGNRPSYPDDPAFEHPMEYAGKSVTTKLADIRAVLMEKDAAALFVTALDDVAWLYNIRGRDIDYNPVVRSYAMVEETKATLYIDDEKTVNITDHLQSANVVVKPYEDALTELMALSNTGVNIMLPDSSLTPGCSYKVFNTVAENQRIMDIPPTLTMKAMKNSVELQKMTEAHVYDGIAMAEFMAYLEAQIISGKSWTELTAQNLLTTYREQQPDYVMLSFTAISGYGPNGAIIHYSATTDTDTPLGTDSLYVLDSGAQYLGATTDVTRTFHFGSPNAEMIEMYTRVLQGTIDFGSVIFPYGTKSSEIDILARRAIYDVGLDYRHGTSHGIGMMLNVHEPKPSTYELGHCMSDEPGYYKDGYWGIRIENQMYVTNTSLVYDYPYYTFEHITMVPMERKLIDVDLLTDKQIEWLNNFHAKVNETVGAKLLQDNNMDAYNWVMERTAILQRAQQTKSGAKGVVATGILILSAVMSIFAM